jgi:hypothetical protein
MVVNNSYLHNLNDSFRSFFEFELLSEGQAYRNVSGLLYRMNDPRLPSGKVSYSTPYGQTVYDSSISGANIPTGVYSGSTFISTGTNGLMWDHERGRAIFDSGVTGNFTATYAVKDFNIYFSSSPDAKLLFENKASFRPKFYLPTTGADPNAQYGPLIYIKRDYATNKPFAIGGEDVSCAYFRAVILSDNERDIDGVGSIFIDAARKNFQLLSNPPLNRYGAIKTGTYYNYLEDVSSNANPTTAVCIVESDYYRFDSTTEASLNPYFYCGFIEFQCELPRFPRA